MKVLLDTCVWGGARVELAAAGHDDVLAKYGGELAQGAIVTVEATRVRIRCPGAPEARASG